MGRVFTNGLGDLELNPGHVIPKTLKMVLDTFLLNPQKYEVHIKGKVEQSWERIHLRVVAIEKGAFGSALTMVANFTYFMYILHTYSSYVRIRDVTLKTCQKRWMIGRSGERGSGISVLAARHDDDDDIYIYIYIYIWCLQEK